MIRWIYTGLQLVCLLVWGNFVFASDNDSIERVMAFSDSKFFNADPSFLQQRESDLLRLTYWGIKVAAPHIVWTTDTDQLPMILAVAQSGDRDWEVRLPYNLILTGTNMKTGITRFIKAFVDTKKPAEKDPQRGPKPPGLALRMALITKLDARQLQMDWDTGIWSLGIINYDWPSNSVVVDLQGNKEAEAFPVLEVNPEPDPRGTGFLPCYLSTDKTPVPPVSGLSFFSKFKRKNGIQHVTIFASFAMTVHDLNLNTPKKAYRSIKEQSRTVTAVIPVTLAVLGLDWEIPVQFDWNVPVYGEPLIRGMTARGNFSIDAPISEEIQATLKPGPYLCYIIMNGKIFGPQKIEIPDKGDV